MKKLITILLTLILTGCGFKVVKSQVLTTSAFLT